MTDFWHFFGSGVAPFLGEQDDPALWQIAVDRILGDTQVDDSLWLRKTRIDLDAR